MDLMSIYDRLVGLSDNDASFEHERTEVLLEDLSRTPVDRRALWLQIQNELNLLRMNLPAEAFRAELFRRIGENLENMEDLFSSIRVQLDDAHPQRPRLAELKLDGPA